MLDKYKEQDFITLKEIALDRLLPSNISVGLIGALIYSGSTIAFLLFALWRSPNITHPVWDLLMPISTGLFIIQAVITIFFFNEKIAFTYQKFQSIFLCLIMFKISIEGYLVFFIMFEDRSAPPYFAQLAIIFLVAGLFFFITSIIRAVKRVKNGHFREGGKGILNFSESKSYVSIPIIFGITMTGGVIARILNSSDTPISSLLELYFVLLLGVVVQFGISLVWPEFLLLAYCKHRFPSFKIEPPERIDL